MQRIDHLPNGTGPVSCALGNFDGVHLGHRALLESCACQAGLISVAVAFRNHPAQILFPGKRVQLLTTADERAEAMTETGIGILAEPVFDEKTARMTPEDFISSLCSSMDVRCITVGYNYTFGANSSGNPETLRALSEQYSFELHILPPVEVNGVTVSSTRIRELLEAGKPDEAAVLLGRPYVLGGPCIRGKQLGRTLGFPTLNLDFPKEKAVPQTGVYAGWVRWNQGLLPAVANLGTNPTVENGSRNKLEVHALGEMPLTYGDRAEFLFGRRLRGECRFDSVEALKAQMEIDKAEAAEWISKAKIG